jgi:hypothetical protein
VLVLSGDLQTIACELDSIDLLSVAEGAELTNALVRGAQLLERARARVLVIEDDSDALRCAARQLVSAGKLATDTRQHEA